MKQVAIRVHYYNHKVVYVGNIKDWTEYLNEDFKDETEILRSASLYFHQIVTIAKQYNHNKFVSIEKELLKTN